MRTAGYLMQDLGFPDGQIPFMLTPNDFTTGGASVTANRPAFGIPAISLAAATTFVASFLLGKDVVQRLGMSDDAQQQFGMGTPSGGFQGAQAQTIGATTPFTTPYGISGRPPIASSNIFTPPTKRPKGIKLKSVTLNYQITGANLSLFTIGIFSTVFSNLVAPAQTTLLTLAGNGLNPNTNAAWQQTTVAIPAANQAYLTTFSQALACEIDITTVTSGVTLLGPLFLNVEYNFN